MKRIRRVFLGGLAAVLPVAITAYILYWIGSTAEGLGGWLFKAVFPDRHYAPGVGVAFGVALIFAAGVLIHLWVVRKLMAWGKAVVGRIPLVKTLYSSVRDLMSYFGTSGEQAVNQVVMISVGRDLRMLGVVTRTQFDDLADGIGSTGDVAVYLPLAYQVGGFTVIVPRAQVQPVDLSFQEAMRLSLTALMSTGKPSPDELPQPAAG